MFGRAISREEFQRQLDANPRNGGMMLSEQQHEALVQTQTEQALSYIEDYLKDEFEITEPDFSDLTRIDLGYTTTEDEKHVIQVYADLEHCTVTKLWTILSTRRNGMVRSMIEPCGALQSRF